MKFAKIINKFGNEFTIPIFKAQEMFMNGEIESFEPIEVEQYGNIVEPQTQREFERSIS